jgi:alcohol dehydrogenase, propanol-preferring
MGVHVMRALRYHGPKQPLRLEDVPEPEAGPGEVVVRVSAAGLCHTELHFLSGLLDLGVAPLTLGHEIVGRIAAVGAGVPPSRVGERVIVYYYAGCGACSACLRGDENLCPAPRAEHGFFTDGGFAERVLAPARSAVSLPDTIEDADAAPIGCGVTTAIHAAGLARIALGEWVVVFGAGGVGFGLVQVARLAGARVIAVGRSPAKLAQAQALGADAVVRAGAEDVAARIRELTGGRGADVIFELVATKETMAASVAALARRGRLVFVGYSEDAFQVHPIQLVVNEQVVTASVGNTLAELKLAVELVAAGRVRTVVDRTFPLERYEEAFDALSAGRLVGRAVLRP